MKMSDLNKRVCEMSMLELKLADIDYDSEEIEMPLDRSRYPSRHLDAEDYQRALNEDICFNDPFGSRKRKKDREEFLKLRYELKKEKENAKTHTLLKTLPKNKTNSKSSRSKRRKKKKTPIGR